jgi:hypothetical protein
MAEHHASNRPKAQAMIRHPGGRTCQGVVVLILALGGLGMWSGDLILNYLA